MSSGSGKYKSINKYRAKMKASGGGSTASGRKPKYKKPDAAFTGKNANVPF